MKNYLLHTPVGVRDIYNGECEFKLNIQNTIHDVFMKYGYSDIQTPTFEFFDIFNKERGSVASKNLYKFFDREGNTLVLRPDMTPSIARAAAKYFMDEKMPIRLCYSGNAFINNSEYQGKLKEFTQSGAELIGDDTSDADAEILVMIIDTLVKSGLNEFQIEVGQPEFFKGLIEESGLDENTTEELRDLLESKRYFGIDDVLNGSKLTDDEKKLFEKFSEFSGSIETISNVKKMVNNSKSLEAIERLEKLNGILSLYGYDKYVSFDLSMLSMYKYYTGIVFKAYTYGTGDAIVTGGRYDNLLNQFGKNAAAIGFAVNVDSLLIAMSRQHISINKKQCKTMILYPEECRADAIRLSKESRVMNKAVLLVRRRSNNTSQDYIEYAKRENVTELLELSKDGIKSIDIN